MLRRLLLLAPALSVSLAAAAENGPRTLTLEDALAALEQQNLSLAQARARAEEARAVARQAKAPLLPIVGANGSYVRNSDEAEVDLSRILGLVGGGQVPAGALPPPLVIQPLDAFNASAFVRVPLFAGNAWWDAAAAGSAADAAGQSLDSARLQLRAGFASTAYLATAAEEVAEAAERALQTASEHEKSTARALAAGTAAPLARLQAQTEVVRRESELARARSELERVRLAMGVLLGAAEPVRVQLPPPDASVVEADVAALVAQALERRPEIKAAQAQVDAAGNQLDSARWRLAPQLSATGTAFASTSPFPTGEKDGWRASVDLSWNLYDGGARYGKRQQAQAQLAAARAGLEAAKVEVRQQVRDAARDVDVARERLRLGEQQVSLAKEAARSAARSYEAGLASSLDVLDANDRVFQAEVALADAHARLGTARATLQRALGTL